MSIMVTSYEHPDLDGAACSAAYAYLMTMQGKEATAAIFSSPQQEATIAFDYFSAPLPPQGDTLLTQNPDIILVDVSDPDNLASAIDPQRVIEIIDHRILHRSQLFPNAVSQIELVGSCATLITEKFAAANTIPPPQLAGPLYGAIVSNTINFMATITTDRDRRMAGWLNESLQLPPTFVHDFFQKKSFITEPLDTILEKDYVQATFGGKVNTIFQLEIVDAEQFLINHVKEFEQIIEHTQHTKNVDVLFVNCIDIEKGYNCIYANDTFTQTIVSSILGVEFTNNIATTTSIVMRKQIAPLLKSYLEKNTLSS